MSLWSVRGTWFSGFLCADNKSRRPVSSQHCVYAAEVAGISQNGKKLIHTPNFVTAVSSNLAWQM